MDLLNLTKGIFIINKILRKNIERTLNSFYNKISKIFPFDHS